jgi:hypothetical protein
VSGLICVIGHVLRSGLIAWGALAILYSNLPWPAFRVVLSLLFAAFGIWALWFARAAGGWMLFAAAFVAVLMWWLSIPPSHDRLWRPEVAVMPRAVIEGDHVRISNVRDFHYRTVDVFTPRYQVREVFLSHLTGVDFYVSYWMPGPIGHTFVSFVFDNAPPISISIEARPEEGEGYAPIASLFKQFELIYVVGDERDIVRVRTNYRGEDVYLYHTRLDRENARRLFEIYLARINELADRPEFYHLLSNSCTINIVRYARSIAGGGRFDIRHYLNGLFDAYLYDLGVLNTKLPFDELRSRSLINDVARSADDGAEFPERIRRSLPSVRP